MSMTSEAADVTAVTVAEAQRDLPNVPADRQALGLVKPYLGMVAWPTVFFAIALVAAFTTVTTLGAMHIIPLWLCLILNTFILYFDQTPLHEACHGNIASKDSRWLWLNHLVGYVCGVILLQLDERGDQDMVDHPRRSAHTHHTGNLRVDACHLALDLVDLELDAFGPDRDQLPGCRQRKGTLLPLEQARAQGLLEGCDASGDRRRVDLEAFRRERQPSGTSQRDQVGEIRPILRMHFCRISRQNFGWTRNLAASSHGAVKHEERSRRCRLL